MAKRSREDFEPLSEAEIPANAPAVSVVHFSSPVPSAKVLQLDPDSGGEARSATEMKCSLPPHRETLSFPSFEAYEVHYSQTHMNRCLECRKNFPTEHFLNLHIEENHDALVSVRKERGEKMYSCLVQDCDRKCSTAQKRRMHLIDKHTFPKDYDFYVINDGIDNRSSMLRSGRHRRRSSAAQHSAEIQDRANRRNSRLQALTSTEGEEKDDETSKTNPEVSQKSPVSSPPGDADIESLTGAMSSLKFVPPSVRFGRGSGRGRGGFSKT